MFPFRKKPRLILHIGRHKTGTTAVQRFLDANRELLLQQGISVPGYEPGQTGHHKYPAEVKKEALDNREYLEKPDANRFRHTSTELAALYAQARKQRKYKTVLSSEAFQNTNPRFVAASFSGFDTRVVVYLRNQLDYLTSAYAQRIHATDYCGSLAAYAQEVHKVNYQDFLSRWDKWLGGDLTVRKFARSSLAGGDIVQDFIQYGLLLDPGIFAASAGQGDSNPSLNEKVVQFKRHLNKSGATASFNQHLLYKALPQLNARFPAGKLRVDLVLKNRMLARCLAPDEAVAKRYFGQDQLFDYQDYEPVEQEPLSAAQMDVMRTALEELITARARQVAHRPRTGQTQGEQG